MKKVLLAIVVSAGIIVYLDGWVASLVIFIIWLWILKYG